MSHAFTTLFPFFQVFLTTKFIFPRQTAFRPKTGIQTSPAGGTKCLTPLKSVPNRQTRRFRHVCRGTVPASVVFPAAGTAAFARTQQTSPETRDFKTAANFAVRHETVLPRRQSIQPRTNPGFVRPATSFRRLTQAASAVPNLKRPVRSYASLTAGSESLPQLLTQTFKP